MDLQRAGLAVAVALPACCGVGATLKAGLNGAILGLGPLGLVAAGLAATALGLRALRREPLQPRRTARRS